MATFVLCPHCMVRNSSTNCACYACGQVMSAPRIAEVINQYADLRPSTEANKNGKPVVNWGAGDPFLNDNFRGWRKVTNWFLQEENLILFVGCGWLFIIIAAILCFIAALALAAYASAGMF